MGLKWLQKDEWVDNTGRLVSAALRMINGLQGNLDTLSSQYSTETSYPSDFTDPLIQADDLGNITIANHSRTYGDGKVVAVTGAVIASGLNPGDIVHLYYDDPLRVGGAVTYAYTVYPTTPPIQAGSRIVVGRVEMPGVGTSDGTYLHPPGWL